MRNPPPLLSQQRWFQPGRNTVTSLSLRWPRLQVWAVSGPPRGRVIYASEHAGDTARTTLPSVVEVLCPSPLGAQSDRGQPRAAPDHYLLEG